MNMLQRYFLNFSKPKIYSIFQFSIETEFVFKQIFCIRSMAVHTKIYIISSFWFIVTFLVLVLTERCLLRPQPYISRWLK